jgi:type II secretory pathway pseudopilin PulG
MSIEIIVAIVIVATLAVVIAFWGRRASRLSRKRSDLPARFVRDPKVIH